MSKLDNFKVFNFNEGVPYASITTNGLTFNKSVVMKLGYPQYVLFLIDEESKQIAIQKSAEGETNAVSFYKEKKSGVLSVRWNGRDLLSSIASMMGWNLEQMSFKVYGELIKDEGAILFDLKSATELK